MQRKVRKNGGEERMLLDLFLSIYNLSFDAYLNFRLIFVKLQKKPLNLWWLRRQPCKVCWKLKNTNRRFKENFFFPIFFLSSFLIPCIISSSFSLSSYLSISPYIYTHVYIYLSLTHYLIHPLTPSLTQSIAQLLNYSITHSLSDFIFSVKYNSI